MRDTSFFNRLLNLEKPWKVQHRVLASKHKQLDIFLEHRRPVPFGCPECDMPLPIYDHAPTRCWRHLDHGEHMRAHDLVARAFAARLLP